MTMQGAPNWPAVAGLTRVLPEGLLAAPGEPMFLTHSYNRPWPAALEDGWAPYWITTDQSPLVLPPSTSQQLGPQTISYQGDSIIMLMDMVATSTYILSTGATTVWPDLGFRVKFTFGGRTWGLDNTQNGVKGEFVFGNGWRPSPMPGGVPWLLEPGTSVMILTLAFTNTTTATNTVEILQRGWRRDKRNG